tara:strand:+ start:655 stop:1473 length:819 start_codon:yes stop_codon:yes gene_type:complete
VGAPKYGHWDTSLVGKFNPGDHFGFVYQITHKESGKSYIGCKHLYKYKKTKRTTESNWKYYCSSSKYLAPDIKKFGKRAFSFVILLLCKNKRDLYYNEMKAQVDLDVLGSDDYYNKNIGGRRFFRPVESYQNMSSSIDHYKYIGPFTITYDNGVEHRVENMNVREFAERHGYIRACICDIGAGRQKTHKNIVNFRYDGEPDKDITGVQNHKNQGPFTVTYKDGSEQRVEDMSQSEFCRRYNYNKGELSSVRYGRIKYHKNIVKVEYDKDKND